MKSNTGNSMVIDLDEDVRSIVDEDGPVSVQKDTPDPDVIDEDIHPDDKLPEHAVLNQGGTVTLPLLFPVSLKTKKNDKITERKFDELLFHRLNGADHRAIAAASKEAEAPVSFARSTRSNQAVMNALYDKMDLADIINCSRVINHFLTSGPKTGKRASAS